MTSRDCAMPSQLPLDFTVQPQMDDAHFFVNDANAAAHTCITRWPEWPTRAVYLTGPWGSGKTHLAEIWAKKAQAVCVKAAELNALELVKDAAYVVEDIDASGVCEAALFHLLNTVREVGAWLLLTGQEHVTLFWPTLPDLASRLRALPHITLGAPDDTLMRAVLLKQFKDRQLHVEPDVIDYMLRRMGRSPGMARVLVNELDREALALGRRVTRPIAAQVLARLEEFDA